MNPYLEDVTLQIWPVVGRNEGYLRIELKKYILEEVKSTFLNRVFSLTWPASIQIYCNKRKRLHKKSVQLPQDWFGTPIWPPFHCFGTPIWPP